MYIYARTEFLSYIYGAFIYDEFSFKYMKYEYVFK